MRYLALDRRRNPLIGSVALLVFTLGGSAAAMAAPYFCKWDTYTIGPGQKQYGQSCSWKYGCSCSIRMCFVGGRWRVQGLGKSCINLPG